VNFVRTSLVCAGIFLGHLAVNAQTCPKIPEEYSWETPAQYKKDQGDIKKCLEYLCDAPLSYQVERSEVNAYVMEWLSGSPDITVDIDTRALPFLSYNEELIFPVVHGMALFQFTHPNITDKVVLHAHGIEVLAKLVDEDPTLRREEYMKDILKAARRNKLESWVCSQFNS
jgi:hypothetical protein